MIGGVPFWSVAVQRRLVVLVNVEENAAPVQFQQVIRAALDVTLSFQPSQTWSVSAKMVRREELRTLVLCVAVAADVPPDMRRTVIVVVLESSAANTQWVLFQEQISHESVATSKVTNADVTNVRDPPFWLR